ncbi:MAG TPA: hypothetical protein VIK91_00530 [Nannocystis sp.]
MTLRSKVFACVFAAAGLVGACVDLSDELDNEPCTENADCWHTQECAQTVDEIFLGLPGRCKPKGTGCVAGQQLGCQCVPYDPSLNCTAPLHPTVLVTSYPRMVCHQTSFVCVIAPQD